MLEITKKWYIFTSALKLFSSAIHGNDSVILCERYEVRDLTPNLSGFHSAATVALYRVLPSERMEREVGVMFDKQVPWCRTSVP